MGTAQLCGSHAATGQQSLGENAPLMFPDGRPCHGYNNLVMALSGHAVPSRG